MIWLEQYAYTHTYRVYNPAKLSELDHLVGKFGEETLLDMVKQKYLGSAPSSTSYMIPADVVQQVSHTQE